MDPGEHGRIDPELREYLNEIGWGLKPQRGPEDLSEHKKSVPMFFFFVWRAVFDYSL